MASGKGKKDVDSLINDIKNRAAFEERASKSIENYNNELRKLYDLRKTIALLDEKLIEFTKEEIELKTELNRLMRRRASASEINEIKKKIKANEKLKKRLEEVNEQYKLLGDETATVLNNISKSSLLMKQIGGDANNVFKAFKGIGGFLTGGLIGFGIRDMLSAVNPKNFMGMVKATKQTAFEMGITGMNAGMLKNNLRKAAGSTYEIGVNLIDLAKMQSDYSKSIGRNIILTSEEAEAMGALSTNASLGVEGASDLVANMQMFNVSAKDTKGIVDDYLIKARKMGLNAMTSIEKMKQALKIAQTYQFKGGIKGMKEMALLATKMQIDIESMATMADKAFSPEGAIEMGASLQVMGGAFAKIADPLNLLYRARNDMKGLAEDVAKASAEFVEIGVNGETMISAYQRDRLKAISEATGYNMEELSKMARRAKEIQMITAQTKFTNKEDVEFLQSIARFDQEKGAFGVTVGNTFKTLKELSKQDLFKLKENASDMEKMKKDSLTFNEEFQNMIMGVQTKLLPVLDKIDTVIGGVIDSLVESLKSGTFAKTIDNLGKAITNVIDFFANNNPLLSIGSALGAFGLFEAAKWYMNGKILRSGFDSGGGFGGGSSMTSSLSGGSSTRGRRSAVRGGKAGKFLYRNGKMAGALGLFGTGLLNVASNNASGEDTMLSDAIDLGTMGAGIGLQVGGPVGALAGAGIGALAGVIKGYFDEKATEERNREERRRTVSSIPIEDRYNDFIYQKGKISKIHNKDSLIGFKPNDAVDNLARRGGMNNSNQMNITFQPLTINGSINLIGNNNSSTMELGKNPIFIRELSKLIIEELKRNSNGKLT